MRWTYLYLFSLFYLVVCVAGLPTDFIKTKKLRNSRYRKDAIKQHTGANPGYIPTSAHHADHLLELQQVTSWLNKNHKSAKPDCLRDLKVELNQNENLAMVRDEININKGRAVNILLAGGTAQFSAEARQHVNQHRKQILDVAKKVDLVLSKNCGLKKIGSPIEVQSKEIYGFT